MPRATARQWLDVAARVLPRHKEGMRSGVVLASASPRRRELLAKLGVEFTICPPAVDEQAAAAGLEPPRAVAAVAQAKAREVARDGAVVVAADTIVVVDGRVLGKPRDSAEAVAMLRGLRSRWHTVLTGLAVARCGSMQTVVFATDVLMRAYGEEEIARYVGSGAALDKAGAYGVQDAAFAPVAQVLGCQCNVMGLPLWPVWRMLAASGVVPPRDPGEATAPCQGCPLAKGEDDRGTLA